MGTPEFAVPALRAVARACEVVLVVTQPDRPRGRGMKSAESAIAVAAAELELPVIKPENMKDAGVATALRAANADLFAVVAFGAILTREVLALPRLGCVNLHGSLLPDYRGASPVQRALWDGRAASGVTTLFMDEGIDTGDCVLQRWAPIDDDDDAAALAQRLSALGGPLLAETLKLAHAGDAPRVPQDRATGSYAKKLAKADGVIEWALDAETVWNRARAVTPWPGAQTSLAGRRVTIVKSKPLHRMSTGAAPGTVLEANEVGVTVACEPGALQVLQLKPEGRAELAAAEWARGARLAGGERFEALKERVS